MRKKIGLIATTFLFCFFCNAKEYYYEGIKFSYDKKWNFLQEEKIKSIKPNFLDVTLEALFPGIRINPKVLGFKKNGSALLISIQKCNKPFSVDNFLEEIYENILLKENYKVKLREDGECELDNRSCKYLDITFKKPKKEKERIYCYKKDGYCIQIVIRGKEKDFFKPFEKIIETFSFYPE